MCEHRTAAVCRKEKISIDGESWMVHRPHTDRTQTMAMSNTSCLKQNDWDAPKHYVHIQTLRSEEMPVWYQGRNLSTSINPLLTTTLPAESYDMALCLEFDRGC